MKETQRRPMTPRLTNAIMLVLAWAAGACASMHSVLLSTQVSHAYDHKKCLCSVLSLLSLTFVPSVSLWVSFSSTSSHIREIGGTFLPAHSLFLRLPGIWFGHGPGHTVH